MDLAYHYSASEREDIDDTQEVNETPLISLFSKIVLEGNDKVSEKYIPLNKLSLDGESFNNLKPTDKKEAIKKQNSTSRDNSLWDEFNSEFELIQNKTDFNTLLALLKKYASTMPSAAYKSKSDISLYDHSKTTAALAVSRYLFNRDGDVKLTQTNDLNCYLAIEGDISGIEKSELDSAYNSGKNGDERFTKFYNDYLNFKISCYITQIIRGKTVSKALKNSNLTDEELKDNLKEIESRILDKQMNSVIGEIAKNRTTRQAAKKARIRIDEVYRWYIEGKKGNEKFKDFADIYHELYVEMGCEIFQNFLNKGKTPKQILKIMNEDITREDYEFWIKNNLISDKNVEAKLYTEDEIKEKIENEGFRQKEEKSLSGLSIIGC